jgi:glutamate 5-kinase
MLQVRAAVWALERDVAVVIGDGFADHTIRGVMRGKKVGTFFTKSVATGISTEEQAAKG